MKSFNTYALPFFLGGGLLGFFLGSSCSESESSLGLDRGLAFLVLLVFLGLSGGDFWCSFSESVADTNLGLEEEEELIERDLERDGDLEIDRELDRDLDRAGLLLLLRSDMIFARENSKVRQYFAENQDLFGISQEKLSFNKHRIENKVKLRKWPRHINPNYSARCKY